MKTVRMLTDVAASNAPLHEAIDAAKKLGMRETHNLYPRIKTRKIGGKKVAFAKGAELPMSDESAKKYVALGIGEIVETVVESDEEPA